MPQLLHYLKVDKSTSLSKSKSSSNSNSSSSTENTTSSTATATENEMSESVLKPAQDAFANSHKHDFTWGTIDIYTCSSSCSNNSNSSSRSGFSEEFVYIQPSIDRDTITFNE